MNYEAIQIIRDTLRGGGVRQCHQMTQGGGGQPIFHVSVFEQNFNSKAENENGGPCHTRHFCTQYCVKKDI